MEYRPIFTIIVCAYNAENRIKKAIDSIVNQKFYSKLVNCFLLVDNNSKDNTALIMKEYEQNYNNIKYVFERQQGLSFARLAGVRCTKTEWIAFVDDDNILSIDWLERAYNYIIENKNIGAFNGAVVPQVTSSLDNEQKLVLKAIYKGLACTHLNKHDIDYAQNKHPAKIPFGAGLVIRAESLINMADHGWIKVTGRNGDKLSSGEDTEMCIYVKKMGYEFGYNPYMLIEHMIPTGRLSKEYAIRLWQGFAEYNIYRQGNIFSIKIFIKMIIKYIRSNIFSRILINSSDRFKWFLDLQISTAYFKKICWLYFK